MEAGSSKLQEELSMVNAQLNHEQGSKGALENVLERSREESLQQRLTNEELTQQLNSLRQQVISLEHKHREVDELKRQVANEKYERARAMEESRTRYTVQTRVLASSTYGDDTSSGPSTARTTDSSEQHTPRTTSHVTLTTNVSTAVPISTQSTSSQPLNTMTWALPLSRRILNTP
ncbi:hypothetical protein B566_EDAN003947 [Ephemera danica]|nr:hypothetical protein B566_EDAN003947 [Ephemera danica]